MRHLSAWAAAFLFFAGFFLAFFDFWGDTPGPEFRGNSRERGPRSPRNRAREFDPPLGARAVRPEAGARGRPGAGRGGGFPPGEGGRGRAAARQKRGGACAGTGGLRRARARRAGGCPAAGRHGGTRGQIRRAAAGRGGPGAGGKSAGRVGRGAGFWGRGAGFFGAAPIFGGGGRKNPRFCFKEAGFFARFFLSDQS